MVNISQKVSIECKYLDSNIKQHIFNKLVTVMKGVCTLEYGYIINIIKIVDIGNNKISASSSLAIFNVIYEADTLKPLVGSVFKGNVCMIFENGFMVNIKDKMKVFVPNYLLTNFKYISGNFVNDKFTIYENTVLNIEIIMIKYEKKEYSCIGKYIL